MVKGIFKEWYEHLLCQGNSKYNSPLFSSKMWTEFIASQDVKRDKRETKTSYKQQAELQGSMVEGIFKEWYEQLLWVEGSMIISSIIPNATALIVPWDGKRD